MISGASCGNGNVVDSDPIVEDDVDVLDDEKVVDTMELEGKFQIDLHLLLSTYLFVTVSLLSLDKTMEETEVKMGEVSDVLGVGVED